MNGLPIDAQGWGEGVACCPWCRQDTHDATVTLEQLADAHDHGELTRWRRHEDGTAYAFALTATTSCCGKPVLVSLFESGMQLSPVRTEADARLIGQGFTG